MSTMTPITKSGTSDAKNTASGQVTKWDRVAVAFARIVALQIVEWMKLRKMGVRVFWKIIPVKDPKSGSGTSVLAVYFNVPLHEIGLQNQESATLDNVPLSEIVLETALKT